MKHFLNQAHGAELLTSFRAPKDPLELEDGDEIDTGAGDAFADDDDADDNSTRAILARELKKQMDTLEDDEEAFGGDLKPEKGPELVGMEDGAELLEKASRGTSRKQGASIETDEGQDDGTPKEPEQPEQPAGDKPKAPIAATSIDLTGLDEDRANQVRTALAVVDPVMGLFKGQEAELAARGVTPAVVVERLMELNTYANEKPAEYLAWVAEQTDAKNPEKILEGAAKLLGFKIVPENEDPFEDEATKALKEENRMLKGPRILGPNDPARQTAQELNAFVNEVDDTGAPVRPHFNALKPQIMAAAKALREKEGRGLTMQDLGQIYDEVATGLGIATRAAQAAPPVADTSPNTAANDRARKASKSIDGSGQGADRRPALSPGASIKDTLRHFAGMGSSD